jgi:hypothetical protein
VALMAGGSAESLCRFCAVLGDAAYPFPAFLSDCGAGRHPGGAVSSIVNRTEPLVVKSIRRPDSDPSANL